MKDFKVTCKNMSDIECYVRVSAYNEADAKRRVLAKNKYLTIISVAEQSR